MREDIRQALLVKNLDTSLVCQFLFPRWCVAACTHMQWDEFSDVPFCSCLVYLGPSHTEETRCLYHSRNSYPGMQAILMVHMAEIVVMMTSAVDCLALFSKPQDPVLKLGVTCTSKWESLAGSWSFVFAVTTGCWVALLVEPCFGLPSDWILAPRLEFIPGGLPTINLLISPLSARHCTSWFVRQEIYFREEINCLLNVYSRLFKPFTC